MVKTNTHQYDMIMTKPPPLNYHSLLAGRYLSPCTSLISVSVKWSRRGGGGGGGAGSASGLAHVYGVMWTPAGIVHTGSRQIDCAPGQTPGVTSRCQETTTHRAPAYSAPCLQCSLVFSPPFFSFFLHGKVTAS